MKRILTIGLVFAILATSCKKTSNVECSTVTPSDVATVAETAYLQNFLNANSITALGKNGMFYTLTQGTGTSPNDCNSVTIDYIGNLISGTTVGAQFDASQAGAPSSFPLNKLISAWRIILPLVKSGGTVTIFVPPSLAYGNVATGSIPANSYLRFIITLRAV